MSDQGPWPEAPYTPQRVSPNPDKSPRPGSNWQPCDLQSHALQLSYAVLTVTTRPFPDSLGAAIGKSHSRQGAASAPLFPITRERGQSRRSRPCRLRRPSHGSDRKRRVKWQARGILSRCAQAAAGLRSKSGVHLWSSTPDMLSELGAMSRPA